MTGAPDVLRAELEAEYYRWRWHRPDDAPPAELELWTAGYLAGGRGAIRNSMDFVELVPRLRELLGYFDAPQAHANGLEPSDTRWAF